MLDVTASLKTSTEGEITILTGRAFHQITVWGKSSGIVGCVLE